MRKLDHSSIFFLIAGSIPLQLMLRWPGLHSPALSCHTFQVNCRRLWHLVSTLHAPMSDTCPEGCASRRKPAGMGTLMVS